MSSYDFFHNKQTESKPFCGAGLRRICMDKWVEYRILSIAWNRRALVGYSEYDLRSLRFDGDKDARS